MTTLQPGLTDLQIEFFIKHDDPQEVLDRMDISEIRELPQITYRAYSAVKEYFQK